MSVLPNIFDPNNLSVEICILELIKIALKKNSSSIAVRFNPKEHKIQVVDNGIGFSKHELSCFFNYEKQCYKDQWIILNHIICVSNTIIITSRSEFSSHTYVLVVNVNKKSNLFKGYRRPSKGTTITIYDFNISKWDNQINKNLSISYVIAAIAFIELKVSFSLRNDEQQKIIFNISKWHNPWQVLKYFTNNKIYHLSSHSLVPMLKEDNININENFISLSQMSIWSDWSYHSKNSDIDQNVENNIRNYLYKFLPISIYKLLPYKHYRILNDNNYFKLSQFHSVNVLDNNTSNFMINHTAECFQNVTNIRVCNMKFKFNECKLSRSIINSLKILKQINKEFIVGITNENEKKLLIIMDQHAVHERIRYEYLIKSYKEKKTCKYLSVKLSTELWISDINENLLKLIVLHKNIFTRVGINIKRISDSRTCVVDAVPKCFIKKKNICNHKYSFYLLLKNVRLLLLEIANGLIISKSILPPVLPITIHNVIASEACHEAIKFGDPLSVNQCQSLVQALKYTKAPTRCAHGRPSIIPLMDLLDLKHRKISSKVSI